MTTYSKVQTGNRLPGINQRVYNDLMDVIAWFKSSRNATGGDGLAGLDQNRSIIRIKNGTGAAQSEGAVLGISEPIFAAEDAETVFRNTRAVVGIAPTRISYKDGHCDGRLAILCQPLNDGKQGRAIIAGVAAVQVDLVDTWHFRADLIDSDPTKLRSYPGGCCQILAIDRTSTGTKWAYVRIGVNPEIEFDGVLNGTLSAGGSAGMSIWQLGSSDWEDTTWDATVYAPRIMPTGGIASGKKVTARWHAQAQRLIVNGKEC